MTARHAATEPWWHVYTRGRPGPRARAARAARRRPGRRSRLRDAVGRRAPADVDRAGPDARPGPAAPRRAGGEPRPGRPRDASSTTSPPLAGEARPAAIVLVSHHVEEIPPGFSHALVLADGGRSRPVRSTTSCATTCSAAHSACRSSIERRDGTRLGTHGRTRRREPLTRDTRMSHRTPDDAAVSTTAERVASRPASPRRRALVATGRAAVAGIVATAAALGRLRAARRAAARGHLARRGGRPGRHRPPAARRQGLRGRRCSAPTTSSRSRC